MRPLKSGSAYILAIVTLVVGLVVALAMLRYVGADYRYETSEIRRQAAKDVAEAGIDYAIWQIEFEDRNVPFTATVNLDTGTAQVVVADDSPRAESTVLITSTGAHGGYRRVARRSMVILPYMYAWCQNSDLSTDKAITSVLYGRGMHVNGSVTITKLITNITTGVWATGSISSQAIAVPQHPNSPAVKFPEIDYDYYSRHADVAYSGETTFYEYSGLQGIVFVDGRAILESGTYDGMITLVATGDIDVRGNLARGSSESYLALVTTGQIQIESEALAVDAVCYSHKPDNNGLIRVFAGLQAVHGCLAGDSVQVDSALSMEHDDTLTMHVMRHLRLPGLQQEPAILGGG